MTMATICRIIVGNLRGVDAQDIDDAGCDIKDGDN